MIDLSLVHPTLSLKMQQIQFQLNSEGTPIFFTQGVRTAEYQHSLYQIGRTLPGKIVTNCDGFIIKSNHQVHADGFGHAIDIAFTGNQPYDASHPWLRYGNLVRAAGLVWGGDFTHFIDQPHAELP